MFVLFRLGILVFIVMSTTGSLLAAVPTLDFSAWYASSMIAAFAILFGLAAYSFLPLRGVEGRDRRRVGGRLTLRTKGN